MQLCYKNPYLKRSKFQQNHPPTLSYSTPSLPPLLISSCPTKKYSRNTQYDYYSSYSDLSQKVVYRMFAEYYKLQANDARQYQPYKHIQTCLLNSHIKKNPFKKLHLVDIKQQKRDLTQSFNNPHWTQDATKHSTHPLQDPPKSNFTQNAWQYNQTKQKITSLLSQNKSDRLISANSIFNKNTFKLTLNDDKQKNITIQPQQIIKPTSHKQTLSFQNKKIWAKQRIVTLSSNQQDTEKQQQDQNIPAIPKQVQIGGRTFHFVKFGN